MGDDEKIPTGRLGRIARLARAGASTGLAMLRSGDATPGAQKAAALLGELRGVATKVGQMVGYVDGLVPPEHRAAFDRSMGHLRNAAPKSSPQDVRRIVRETLDAEVEAIFDRWDDAPIASASIGQVHRARLHDGRDVAVKVQHAGIAEAMEADLRNAGLMNTAARAMGMGRFEVGRFVDEARQRFREELDYGLEAERMRRFAALHEGDPNVVVPAVVDEASGSRVLTSTFIEAMSFEQACEAAADVRRRYAETMWRFAYASIMLGGLFNADPHPGNYFFFEDGRVAFLDFGCVQEIVPFHQRQIVTAHQAIREGDLAGFETAMAPMLNAKPGAHEHEMNDYMRLALRPILESPFRITPDYAAAVVRRFKAMVLAMRKLKRGEFEAMPPGILFLTRLQFGFYSVLARLDVEADYAAVEASFLDEAVEITRDLPASPTP